MRQASIGGKGEDDMSELIESVNAELDRLSDLAFAANKAVTEFLIEAEAAVMRAAGLNQDQAAEVITGRIAARWVDQIFGDDKSH